MMYNLILKDDYLYECYEFQSSVPIDIGDIISRDGDQFQVLERRLILQKRSIQYVDLYCKEVE